jgi:hypothetical protein
MDKITAQRIVRDTFKVSFDKGRYRNFVNELCNGFDETKAQTMRVPDAFARHIKSCLRNGTFESKGGELADILTVHLTESYKLERTRTALRDFVGHKLKRGDGEDNSYKEAALVAFVAPDSQSWRFSYVRMEYETKRDPSTGKIKPEALLTPARRYSYLVGEEEECHTAQSRFLALLQNTSDIPTLDHIEEAFSVDAVTDEFFDEYAAFFEKMAPFASDGHLRQAMVMCWMMMPRAGGRNFGDVKKIVAKIFQRNLAAWEEDNRTFSGPTAKTKPKRAAKSSRRATKKKPAKRVKR